MSLFKIFIFIIILNLLYQNILKSKKYRRYNYFQKKKLLKLTIGRVMLDCFGLKRGERKFADVYPLIGSK